MNVKPSLFAERVGEVQVEPVAKRPRQDSDSEGEGEVEARPVEPSVLQDVVSGAPVVEVHAHLAEATDTEKKAVQLRAGKSLEERQRQFKEMLLERGVSRAIAVSKGWTSPSI